MLIFLKMEPSLSNKAASLAENKNNDKADSGLTHISLPSRRDFLQQAGGFLSSLLSGDIIPQAATGTAKASSTKSDWIELFCSLTERQHDFFVSLESAARIMAAPRTDDDFTYNLNTATHLGWAMNHGARFEFPNLTGSKDLLSNFPIEHRETTGTILSGPGIGKLRSSPNFQTAIKNLSKDAAEKMGEAKAKHHYRMMESKVTSYIVKSLERTPQIRVDLRSYLQDPLLNRESLGFNYLRVFKDSNHRQKLATDPVFQAFSNLGQALTTVFGDTFSDSAISYIPEKTIQQIRESIKTLSAHNIEAPQHIKTLIKEADFAYDWGDRKSSDNNLNQIKLPYVLRTLVEGLLPATWSGNGKAGSLWQSYSTLLNEEMFLQVRQSVELRQRWSFSVRPVYKKRAGFVYPRSNQEKV